MSRRWPLVSLCGAAAVLGFVAGTYGVGSASERDRQDNSVSARPNVPRGFSNLVPPWPPVVPVGLDAYRQWARWPYQRIGVRGYMRSTYDRDGLNRTADASHFLYGEGPGFNVTLDVLGPGILYFVRTNKWHGSPWHYEVDGLDHVVRETSTADPHNPVPGSRFEPSEVFPPPLAWTWSTTKGADLNWVPVPFERSLRIAYGRTFYGTGYYIYHQFVEGIPLSSQLQPFDFRTPPDRDVLELLRKAGTDIAPTDIADRSAAALLEPRAPLRLFQVEGPSTIRALKITLPRDRALELSHARLRVTWDGRDEPSIDAPLALFFGAGLFYNRDDAEHLVKAFPVGIRYSGNQVDLSCYLPMPFFRSARIELIPPPELKIAVSLVAELRHELLGDPPSALGYLHATYSNLGGGAPGKDHVLLDTRGIEGSDDWSGSFIGTSFSFTDKAELRTLEGDPRFFFDDARSPQAYGTGTEEWGGGGDYWGGQIMTLPLAGHPIGAPTPSDARAPEDLVHSAYRFLLADLFPFGKNARIQLEHGGANDMFEPYRTVAYWYGLPAASLVRTDELIIGDPASERAHEYRSPDATTPRVLTSRYDLGPDRYDPLREGTTPAPPDDGEGDSAAEPTLERSTTVYPAESQLVRYTRGSSEFTLRIDTLNHGVMLRRTLDYGAPNQRAVISVADGESSEPAWEPAGTWYLAGSNTFYHSFPKDELGSPVPDVRTSNRRFREDEFLLPLRLTENRRSLRVRVACEPMERPLLPGMPVSAPVCSEIRYQAYSWVEPDFKLRPESPPTNER
ncbi:MAG: DUF2961 domain-containing protein [Rhizobiales bacterium]|nr:DUF2961 domain-containing protein [Hyphomicrobiales bacterium]